MIYITKKKALEFGMTHHGRLFGIPAWVAVTADGVDGVPKLFPMVAWCIFASWLYDAVTFFMPSDKYIEAPVRVLAPIE